MQRFFISTTAEDAVRLSRDHGLGLELIDMCDVDFIDRYPERKSEILEKMTDGGDYTLHGPFSELVPSTYDPKIRAVCMDRFNAAYEIARDLGIKRLILHTGFIPNTGFEDYWAENAARFWRQFIEDKDQGFEILIENVYDFDPKMPLDMLNRIGDPRFGLCLDVGHANVSSRISVLEWISLWGSNIRHCHLHNNDGKRDLHGGLPDGVIDFEAVISAILERSEGVTFALEPYPSAEKSVECLKKWNLI